MIRYGAIYLCLLLWTASTRVSVAWGQSSAPLPVTDVDRIVKSGVLPYSLEDLTERLQVVILHDRPALRSRIWRLLQALYRYEALYREWPLLQARRNNLASIYALYRQQQVRAEVDDLVVLQAHNALLAADRQLVQQQRTRRLVLLEILETALLLDLSEEGHGAAPADRCADTGGN